MLINTKVTSDSILISIYLVPTINGILSDVYRMKIQGLPSVRKDELAAVCVPWGFTNAGESLDTFSIVESPLMPFSVTRK